VDGAKNKDASQGLSSADSWLVLAQGSQQARHVQAGSVG